MKTPIRDEEIERDYSRELGLLRRLTHPRASDHLLSALNKRIEQELQTSNSTQKKVTRGFSLRDWFILPHIRTAVFRLGTAAVVLLLLGLAWLLLIKPSAVTKLAQERSTSPRPPTHLPGDSVRADSDTIDHKDLKKPIPEREFQRALAREFELQYELIATQSKVLAKEGMPPSLGIAGVEPKTLEQCIDAIRDLPSEESVEILYMLFGKGLAFDARSPILHEVTADHLAQRGNLLKAAALYSVAKKLGSNTAGPALDRVIDTMKRSRNSVR